MGRLMKPFGRLSLAMLLILAMGFQVNADASKGQNETQAEINYLLQKIAQTNCVFNRNGSRHQGEEAVAHIQRKYDYFKDDIQTAEDFIRLSASRSTMTRRAYTIECEGEAAVASADWLQAQLAQFRQR